MLRRLTIAALAASLAIAGLIAPAGVTTAQAGPGILPRNEVPATTTYALIRVIPVGSSPQAVAVDQDDDTVYVTNFSFNNVSVIDGRTGLRTDDTISAGSGPFGIAVDQDDDTVYVTNYFANNLSVINARTRTASTVSTGNGPAGAAVDQDDDTVYVTNQNSNIVSVISGQNPGGSSTIGVSGGQRSVALDQDDDSAYVTHHTSNTVSVISGRTRAVSTIAVGTNPFGIAVDQGDDTVYAANYASNTVSVINGRTRSVSAIPVGSQPSGVAVDQIDDTVYVTNFGSNNVSVLNGRTGLRTDDTIAVPGGPYDVAIDNAGPNQGIVYVVSTNSNSISVIGRVAPSLATASGNSGDSVTINVDALQASYDVDDSTIVSISFGGIPLTPTPQSGDAWQVIAPAGTPGASVPVTVVFRGGLTASAGTFTYSSPTPPPPPPAYPPSAPLNVTAVAGDASATVTWSSPTSTGSFPVTHYEVRSNPAGRSCVATSLGCTIAGLINGTAYTFEARALNGAGWGPWSTSSNTITPTPPPPPPPPVTITITGSRGTGADRQVVFVTGTSIGLDSEQVRAHVKLRGQADYRPGRLVDVTTDGTFSWQRTTGKKTYVYFTGASVESNRVVIPAADR